MVVWILTLEPAGCLSQRFVRLTSNFPCEYNHVLDQSHRLEIDIENGLMRNNAIPEFPKAFDKQ